MIKIRLNNNIIKNKIKNKTKKGLSVKKGTALAETILLVAISLVLVVMLFYPTINSLLNSMLVNLSSWFSNSLTTIGII
jgi:hypothetical protein